MRCCTWNTFQMLTVTWSSTCHLKCFQVKGFNLHLILKFLPLGDTKYPRTCQLLYDCSYGLSKAIYLDKVLPLVIAKACNLPDNTIKRVFLPCTYFKLQGIWTLGFRFWSFVTLFILSPILARFSFGVSSAFPSFSFAFVVISLLPWTCHNCYLTSIHLFHFSNFNLYIEVASFVFWRRYIMAHVDL